MHSRKNNKSLKASERIDVEKVPVVKTAKKKRQGDDNVRSHILSAFPEYVTFIYALMILVFCRLNSSGISLDLLLLALFLDIACFQTL